MQKVLHTTCAFFTFAESCLQGVLLKPRDCNFRVEVVVFQYLMLEYFERR
jgi:hypothetical protein